MKLKARDIIKGWPKPRSTCPMRSNDPQIIMSIYRWERFCSIHNGRFVDEDMNRYADAILDSDYHADRIHTDRSMR